MKKFMDENFLLKNKTSEKLYQEAASMPIYDYHCHLVPSQIAENKRFDSITEAWLGADHYKWRQMRTCGISEKLITGDGDDFDKFYAWAQTMENLIGNPLYHWTHLELQRYFDIKEVLSRKTAKAIYEETNRKFKEDENLSVFGIMKKFNVYAVGTTDDPIDSLEYHKQIKKSECSAKVLPSFRPDKALNIFKDDFSSYIKALEKTSSMTINNVEDLIKALENRLDFFISLGTKASDHALTTCPHTYLPLNEVNTIFTKKMEGDKLKENEVDAYMTYVLTNLAKIYKKKNIAMQLHFASLRDNNYSLYAKLGPDTGFDASSDKDLASSVSSFLGTLSLTNDIPKTILYTLNPKDYYVLGTLMGCYQGDEIKGKIQLGSAWWFLDHKDGMEEQMKILANLGSLPSFVGMLTDSRSFLSYPRHEYFRRILCNLLGTWAEEGEIPNDQELLSSIVKDICFNNVKNYL